MAEQAQCENLIRKTIEAFGSIDILVNNAGISMWAYFDEVTDLMTHVGEFNGVLYALGYAGHGVAMGTYLGKTVAEAMLGGTIKEHPFAAFPFPNAPLGLYNGTPWFLLLVGAWHRFLDVIE